MQTSLHESPFHLPGKLGMRVHLMLWADKPDVPGTSFAEYGLSNYGTIDVVELKHDGRETGKVQLFIHSVEACDELILAASNLKHYLKTGEVPREILDELEPDAAGGQDVCPTCGGKGCGDCMREEAVV